MTDAIGSDTIAAICTAGPEMQVCEAKLAKFSHLFSLLSPGETTPVSWTTFHSHH